MSLERIQQLLEEAEKSFKSASEESLTRCLEITSEGVALIGEASSTENERAMLLSEFLMLRGKSQVVLFKKEGKTSLLHRGQADLRAALENLPDSAGSKHRYRLEEELAIGLVRCGEQLSQMSLLKEAIAILGEICRGSREASGFVEEERIFNAYSLAVSRLGSLGGDPAKVEEICLELRKRMARNEAQGKANDFYLRTLVIALTDLGRLRSSKKVYEELVDLIEGYLQKGHREVIFLRRHRISAWIALAWLKTVTDRASEAVPDLERAFSETQLLLEDSAVPMPMRIELLHTMAQARARVGIQLKSKEMLMEAIDYCGGSLDLVEQNTGKNDGRLPRLYSDRASYRSILAKLTKDREQMRLVTEDYKKASSLVLPQAAPWLSAKIQARLFYFLYEIRDWRQAMEAFELAEQSWEIVILDPTLSNEVLLQIAFEMCDHYARASRCLLELGEIEKAILCSDRGRAIWATHTQNSGVQAHEVLEEEARIELTNASANWEAARIKENEEECVAAWRHYLDVRRRSGLDSGVVKLGLDDLESRIPDGGALVQILGVDGWFCSLIATRSSQGYRRVECPDDVREKLLALLVREKKEPRENWHASYSAYLAVPKVPSGDDYWQYQFEAWTSVVTSSLKILGAALMGPIHNELQCIGLESQSKVVLLPAGILSALPLASAQLSDSFRFEDHWEVSLIPNLSMLELAQEEIVEKRPHQCLIVTGAANSGRAALPFVSREVQLLEKAVSSEYRKSLDGKEAGLEGVIGGLTGASILHFASHGRFDSDDPERSGIQLSGNQWLTVSRLKATADSKLSARLAYLSCCETGILGKTALPDEFVGLLPAFLQCGARATIGALWPVCDDSAMLMSWRFFKEFLDEEGCEKCHPALALARAKKWMSEVKLATLIEEGLISSGEGLAFAESRFGYVRRRRFGEVDVSEEKGRRMEYLDETDQSLVSSIGDLRIYSSPADWAAYVVVGV